MDAPRLPRTGNPRVLAWTTLVGLALVGSLALVPAVSSASVTSAWQARIGARGANGTAKVQVFTTGTGSLTIKLVKMRPATLLPVVLYKGTCSAVGGVLARLFSIRSSSTGAVTRTSTLTATRVNALVAATRSGKVAIRIGSGSAVRCGVFAALPVAPSPTPSPSGGGTLFLGPFFGFGVPAGWVQSSSGDPNLTLFSGPGAAVIAAHSGLSSLTLEQVGAGIVANLKSKSGADPERTEAITMDGVAGVLLTYHFAYQGVNLYELDAYCVRNGRAYEITFANAAGHESADRALFADVLASFTFIGAGF